MGRRYELIFFWGRYTNGQKAHEKTLDNISHQGNANQSMSSKWVLLHMHWNGYNQTIQW